MADEASETLTVQLGDQQLRLRVDPLNREHYERAATRVNERLQDAMQQGVMAGPRAWAAAAFELALELDHLREELDRARQSAPRLGALIQKIDETMNDERNAKC